MNGVLAYAVARSGLAGGHPPIARALGGLALDRAGVAAGDWYTLAAHWLLQPTLTELAVVLVVLFSAGTWLERRLGTLRFTACFAAAGLWSGAMALWTSAGPVAGGLGPVLGLLGAAIALDGRRRFAGRASARTVWALLAVGCLLVAGTFHLGEVPLAHASTTAALVPGMMAGLWPAWSRRRAERRYRERGMTELVAEHVARERVEGLLAKISSGGMEALSRKERRFLEQASRFYTGGRTPDLPAPVAPPRRVPGRAGSDPA
ncbi:MAG: rhomboid family intramembrane serine protease [Planctomycetota bacterium]|jgi:membrane associated rhomboid family serine protease